jgi:hypothetical protein
MRKIVYVSCMLILALSLAACGSDFDGTLIGNENEFIMDYSVLNKTYAQDLVVKSGDAIRAKIAVENKADAFSLL